MLIEALNKRIGSINTIILKRKKLYINQVNHPFYATVEAFIS